jgi:hypothetical protein
LLMRLPFCNTFTEVDVRLMTFKEACGLTAGGKSSFWQDAKLATASNIISGTLNFMTLIYNCIFYSLLSAP